MKRWILLIPLHFLLCSAVQAGARNEADAEQRMKAAAAVVEPPFELFYVPTNSGGIATATFLVLSKTKGPSKMGKQLAAELMKPRDTLRTLVVSGPSDSITKQVVLDAVGLLEGKRLENLKLVFVGNADVASELRPVVEATGAQYVGVAFESAANKTTEPTR